MKEKSYNNFFSHIYIEKGIADNRKCREITDKFPNARIIYIGHYKDVFCGGNRNFAKEKKSPSLILAKKTDNFIYKGAKVCQDFGNDNFYYTSNIMNCYFDCEYCYLQGMYRSGNIVIFVNMEDIFSAVDEALEKHSVYLCISYDTDMLAMENITGFIKEWVEYARDKENLKIEIRTKSCNIKSIENIKACGNIVFAWTLSPESIIEKYEHLTGRFDKRREAVKKCCELGWKVRLCFDPMIYCKEFEKVYGEAIRRAFEDIDEKYIDGVSIGVFRISKEYMKIMKKQRKSTVTLFPYKNVNGVYCYGEETDKRMVGFAKNEVMKYIGKDKIFVWGEQ
ncbi:MAG: radical SAM protein [Firmicutes bacterium]|nr:radical SAM protein [Bacillota bacterium]